ncbi:MAG TPA: TMEM175 family protein [bacterium]|nr:TMEM175 family protein [bacterium]
MLSNQALDPHFRWRGHEVTRVEAFSDAVFAFAMTLLVVSLEVPKNLSQLLETMRGFPAFATCFTILVMLWYWHYKFFRRFGLQDRFTIVWNAALLFVVLFFVYPLKFVMTLVVNMMLGVAYEQPPIAAGQGDDMMYIYNAGYIAVCGIYALLYHHAYRLRARFELNEAEVFIARSERRAYIINIGIALFSTSLLLYGGSAMAHWAGLTYWLIGPAMGIHGYRTGKKLHAIQLRMNPNNA